MQRIVVPIDFSPTSAAAIRFGTYLAETAKMDLEVLHVFDTRTSMTQTISSRARNNERRRLEEMANKFTRRNVEPVLATFQGRLDVLPAVRSRVVEGSATQQLLGLSREEDVGIIVMGGVGAGAGLQPPGAFGGVARAVALRGGCPVMLIPRGYGYPRVDRLALAFDGPDDIRHMGAFARRIIRALRPEVHFVHVRVRDAGTEQQYREAFHSLSCGPGFPSRTFQLDWLESGPVVRQLLQYTADVAIDLLVLGGERRSFLERLIDPGHLRPLIYRCDIPILIIPFDTPS